MEPLHARRTSGLQERLRPERVRAEEPARIDDREAVVRLGGEVDDHPDLLAPHRALRKLAVADVSLDERDPVLDRGQIGTVARVREQVVDDHVVVRIPLEPVVDEVRADEARAARDEESHRAEG